MEEGFSGGCLCGAVRYESTDEPVLGGHCYCEDCRRSSGAAHSSVIGVPKEALTVTGETRAYERAADSGNVVSRNFCVVCGTTVFIENSAHPEMRFLRAGTLDDPEVFTPQVVVYASRAPSWDKPDDSLPAFAEMPPKEERG